jgi:hypothetical protein
LGNGASGEAALIEGPGRAISFISLFFMFLLINESF